MKDEQEGRIKISAAFLVSFRGNEQSVKTTLSYGRRVSDSRESIINPDQMEMFDGAEPPDEAEQVKSSVPVIKRARKAAQEV
jgi:hypothetical protein